jgi:hypothetical protein
MMMKQLRNLRMVFIYQFNISLGSQIIEKKIFIAAQDNNFDQESCLFAIVLVKFNEDHHFRNHLPHLIPAFFATSCTTLASKPKIFFFLAKESRVEVSPI